MEHDQVRRNYAGIVRKIAEAAEKSGRSPDEITCMAVTKTVDPALVNTAIACGIQVLGENRVQEYQSKKDAYTPGVPVDFIGTLQRNKVKYIVGNVRMIQSVDKFSLAQEIERCAVKQAVEQDILIEVNIGGEASKSGVLPEALQPLLEQVATLAHVHVKGLMTIPPPCEDTRYLEAMQALFQKSRTWQIPDTEMNLLSMGMSDDYAEAILCGANLVRIGSALFGARNYT